MTGGLLFIATLWPKARFFLPMFHFYLISRDSQIGKRNKEKEKKKEKKAHIAFTFTLLYTTSTRIFFFANYQSILSY